MLLGRICTTYYFFHFLVLLPVLGFLEKPLPLPESISRPVLPRGGGTAARGRPRPADGEGMMRRFLIAASCAATLLAAPVAFAQEEAPTPPEQNWSFSGIFGTYDRAALQRGLQVYLEVCSNCHSMKQLYYRNLEQIGLTANQVKALASNIQVPGGVDDSGQPVMRAALPSDHFRSPFPNDAAARAANNGALPPDQSTLEKAREGGADYIYAILNGYAAAGGHEYGAGHELQHFPGHQIAMPKPLQRRPGYLRRRHHRLGRADVARRRDLPDLGLASRTWKSASGWA